MKKIRTGLTLALLILMVLTSCNVQINNGVIDGIDKLPVLVEVTGLEDVTGTANVEILEEAAKAEALAAVKNVYYVEDGAEIYAVDITVRNGEEEVKIGKPVTVTITLPKAELPLERYLVFHVHDGKADQIVPTVTDGKLTFTVDSLSPFLVVPGHEHVFGEWVFPEGNFTCGDSVIQTRKCACGEEQTRDYTFDHADADNDGKCDRCGKEMSVEHTHEFGEWVTEKPATCTEAGFEERKCACGAAETRPIDALGHYDKNGDKKCDRCGVSLGGESQHTHAFGEWTAVTKPTCTAKGLAERSCKCGVTETKELDPIPHNYKDIPAKTPTATEIGWKAYKQCTVCGAKVGYEELPATGEEPTPTSDTYVRDGNIIYFGSYPQTEEKDAAIVSALNELAGGFPGRTEDDYGWISYKYYHGTGDEHLNETTNADDYMWYKDVTYNGIKYRGVYFIQYRPSLTVYEIGVDKSYSYKPTNTFQYQNGYRKTVVSWFRYEPIQWRVLEEKDGSALVIAQLIIDSQAYLNVAEYVGLDDHSNPIYMNTNDGVPEGTYANNYMYSFIRAWLNGTFYNTAFTALQKELIALTTVDNSITSSYPINGNDEYLQWNKGTRFLCPDTEDYIFLPSEVEITSSKYGFTDFMNRYANDKNRIRKYTDYALSQGLWAHGSVYTNNELYGEYWLRSPHQESDNSGSGIACAVDEEGDASSGDYVVNTSKGIVPMLWIKLDSGT